MNMIRPVSDLRDNIEDVSTTGQPVFLTKNGYGNMGVLSKDAYKNTQFESEIYSKLQAAEHEADFTDQRFSSTDVLKAMSDAIDGKATI